MNDQEPSNSTIAWYDRHAQSYAEQTSGIDTSTWYQPFLELLPAGARILDAGCGSGRDTVEFTRRGFSVTAIDASAELAILASRAIGKPVRVLRFEELDYEDAFDGIWTCASLLHVQRDRIDAVLRGFTRALRMGGTWFMSVMLGGEEIVENGRLFNKYTEPSFRELLVRHPALEIVRMWQTDDIRLHRPGVKWLNVLARKKKADGA